MSYWFIFETFYKFCCTVLLGLWINRGAPNHNLWLQAVRSIIPFETFSAALKDKPFFILSALGLIS